MKTATFILMMLYLVATTAFLSGSVNAKVCCETPCDVSNPECETDW